MGACSAHLVSCARLKIFPPKELSWKTSRQVEQEQLVGLDEDGQVAGEEAGAQEEASRPKKQRWARGGGQRALDPGSGAHRSGSCQMTPGAAGGH